MSEFYNALKPNVSKSFDNINGSDMENFIEDFVDDELEPLIEDFTNNGGKVADVRYILNVEQCEFLTKCIRGSYGLL